MIIDSAKGSVKFKVVYHGIALAGKTTNIEQLAKSEGLDILTFDTKQERTLVFDFITRKRNVDSFQLSFSIYTIPGQDIYRDIRRMVMRGADAVVFVVDSSESKLKENKEFLEVLAEDLRMYGKSVEGTPIVIQYNKRDLPDAVPIDTLRQEVNIPGKPYTEAIAVEGKGVKETFELVEEALIERFRQMVG
jgi:small GTP-binding protein